MEAAKENLVLEPKQWRRLNSITARLRNSSWTAMQFAKPQRKPYARQNVAKLRKTSLGFEITYRKDDVLVGLSGKKWYYDKGDDVHYVGYDSEFDLLTTGGLIRYLAKSEIKGIKYDAK